jgi:hypothetical protein
MRQNPKTIEIRGQMIKNVLFCSFLKSLTQMDSLSAKNKSSKFSRLDPFKMFKSCEISGVQWTVFLGVGHWQGHSGLFIGSQALKKWKSKINVTQTIPRPQVRICYLFLSAFWLFCLFQTLIIKYWWLIEMDGRIHTQMPKKGRKEGRKRGGSYFLLSWLKWWC